MNQLQFQSRERVRTRRGWVLPGMLLAALPLSAEVISGRDDESGQSRWEWREAGVSMQLIQRLPDQTRAFFLGRGFMRAEADAIGSTCVFQTIFRNDGSQRLSYDLNDWRVVRHPESLSLLTREYWDARWATEEVSQEARIALRWSLLPTRQSYQPGDYNWGMTSFGLPPGAAFDLSLRVSIGGTSVTATLPGIVCAADR